MKFFLDSAKIQEIEQAFYSFGIDGVTTNPNHVRNSGSPPEQVIADLAHWAQHNAGEIESFPISIEVNPHLRQADDMRREAEDLARKSDYFVIKLPCTLPGISAARKLEQSGIRTNLTLIFSPSQAVAAIRSKAAFISPFVGWKESSGEDCHAYLAAIRRILHNYHSPTQIITAALRTGKQIAEAAVLGMDIVTCSLAVFEESIQHPFTDFGLNKFQQAWNASHNPEKQD